MTKTPPIIWKLCNVLSKIRIPLKIVIMGLKLLKTATCETQILLKAKLVRKEVTTEDNIPKYNTINKNSFLDNGSKNSFIELLCEWFTMLHPLKVIHAKIVIHTVISKAENSTIIFLPNA